MRRVVLSAFALSLAACQQQNGPDPVASETASPAIAPTPSPTGSTTPVATGTGTSASGIPEFGIPAALQGNWGMVPADCNSQRGDAKGLLRISGTTLTFYESVGKLGTIKERTDSFIQADFAFSGEGMTWTRGVTLSVSGDKLTRTERGGEAPGTGGPFTYTRC